MITKPYSKATCPKACFALLCVAGMLKGVQDSDIFLLVLTKGVLQRPFCQLELREAIKLKKRVQLLMEVCDCDTGRVGLSQHAPLCRACSVFPHGTVRSPLSARPGSHIKTNCGSGARSLLIPMIPLTPRWTRASTHSTKRRGEAESTAAHTRRSWLRSNAGCRRPSRTAGARKRLGPDCPFLCGAMIVTTTLSCAPVCPSENKFAR